MTGLREKAERAETQFVAASNLNPGSIWRLESHQPVDAEELGTDEFPQHGDWLECSHDGSVTYFLECPGDLALELVTVADERDLDLEQLEGYWFLVDDVWKDGENSPWRFDLEVATADVSTLEEATAALRDD